MHLDVFRDASEFKDIVSFSEFYSCLFLRVFDISREYDERLRAEDAISVRVGEVDFEVFCLLFSHDSILCLLESVFYRRF